MLAYISILLAVLLLWYTYRALFQPGIALAMMWSLYASEQLLQQGHPIFLRLGSLVNISFTLVCTLAVLNAFQRGRYRNWRMTPEAAYCLALFLLAGLSVIWAVDPAESRVWLKTSLPYLVAFVLVAPLCATDQQQLRLAINTTVLLGTIVMLGHVFSNYDASKRGLTFIVGSQEVHANPLAVATYAGYVGICSLFSIYGRKFSPLVALKIGLILLAAFLIIKSNTRGQLIALVIVSFIWLPIIARTTLKRSTIIPLFGSAVIICGSIYAFNNMLRDTGRWRAQQLEVAGEGRFEMATNLLEYWGNAGPLAWMAGTGNSSSFAIVGFYPHVVPVEVLAEEGIIGFVLLTLFTLSVLSRGSKIMFSKRVEAETRVNMGILLAIFCFQGLLTLKQGSLLGSPSWFSIGLTIGWMASQLKSQAKKSALMERQRAMFEAHQQYQQQHQFP